MNKKWRNCSDKEFRSIRYNYMPLLDAAWNIASFALIHTVLGFLTAGAAEASTAYIAQQQGNSTTLLQALLQTNVSQIVLLTNYTIGAEFEGLAAPIFVNRCAWHRVGHCLGDSLLAVQAEHALRSACALFCYRPASSYLYVTDTMSGTHEPSLFLVHHSLGRMISCQGVAPSPYSNSRCCCLRMFVAQEQPCATRPAEHCVPYLHSGPGTMPPRQTMCVLVGKPLLLLPDGNKKQPVTPVNAHMHMQQIYASQPNFTPAPHATHTCVFPAILPAGM